MLLLVAILMEMTAIVDDTPTDRHLLRLQLLGFTKLLTPLPGLSANALLTAAVQGRGVDLRLFVVL